MSEKKKKKKTRKRLKKATKRAKIPYGRHDHAAVVASDPGNLGRWIFAKNPFLGLFSRFELLGSVICQNFDFRGTKPVNL